MLIFLLFSDNFFGGNRFLRGSNLAKTTVNLLSEESLKKFPLYGDHTFNDISNQLILQQIITFIRLFKLFRIYDSSP